MEQANTQEPMSQEQLMMLTEMVQQLFRERNREQEPEDPHVTIRIPVTDLTSYPALTEALLSIEEGFFRSPLTEEERKIAIHSCPKTSSMNYTPHPLKDTASSTVKKTDSTLYGIHLALAQTPRPIDYYFHRSIQENPGMDTAEDTEILFTSTMRALLADIAATVTQARLNNLHKGLDLPGKPTQLVESENKPLMDQEALDALISKKPAAKRQQVQPFRKRQQSTTSKESYSSNTVMEPNTAAATTAEVNHRTSDFHRDSTNVPSRRPSRYVQIGMFQTDGQPMGSEHSVEGIQNPLHESKISDVESVIGSRIITDEASHRGNPATGSRILQPTVYDPEEDWRPPTCSRPPEAEPSCGRAKLQDGGAEFDMQNDPSEGLSDVTRPPGCFHAHPGLQVVPKVPPLSLEWPLFPIPRPAIRTITDPFGLHKDPPLSPGMSQIERDSCHCISRRFANHGRIERNVPNEHALNLFQDFAAWIQGQFREVVDHAISVDQPLRNGDQLQGNVPQGSNQQDPRSATRGQQNTERWPDDPKEFGELHWESSINVSRSTSWKTDATPTTRAQKPSSVNIKFMDIDSDSEETSNPEPVLLEESANFMERSLVLSRDAGNGYFYRRNRLSLGNSSGPPLLLWNMEPQGSKTPYQHEGTVESALYTEARECKQETRPLLKLVSGQQSTGTERSEPRMDQVQQSVLLPNLEPDSTGSPEGPPRESHNDTTTASPSNNSGPRSENRKVAALGKQALELDGLEYQRHFLETQGFGTYAIDFIVFNERRVRRRSRPVMDISTVIKLLLEWVQNSTFTIKQITAKLYWLLSVTGFLRASNIHRIDEQRSHIDQGVLNLVIVAPKEKRSGRPIEKPCQINPHTDIILCPVNAYMVYKEKIAVNLCPTPHANNSNWVVNRLIRYVKYTSKPLLVDSITQYIHTISDLIRRDPEAPIPKGRAIGTTLAANAGVSSDDIVLHAFWSNYTIFDTYYRHSRNSSNNLTESILNLE
ncbi:hypothetical protein AYI69_g11320 [Smittium culicis]|uniref:Uncharacterized protein n=1 Tax=Smittium culicis TaxID=133412 RepID=A0A1R1WZM5_9FUNG|nr:hypothetical protein AYI69_g11320 [Smittium culicis]